MMNTSIDIDTRIKIKPNAKGNENFKRVFIALIAIILFVFGLLSNNQAVAQTCPANSSLASFDWSTAVGSGNEWLASNDSTGDSQTYTVSYTDLVGNLQTIDVTMTLQDSDAINLDTNFVCDPLIGPSPCDTFLTTTNGAFGSGFLTISEATVSSSQSMGLDFSFPQPVYMSDFIVTDIDDVGYGNLITDEPGDSYQDTVTLTASNGGTNVPLSLSGGSNLSISGQTAEAIYVTGVNGNVTPNDPVATLTASSGGVFDTFSLIYSNGPDDAAAEPTSSGISDGHAIRVSGFDFCVQQLPELGIVKTSSANGGPVSPGDTITYTIDVTNSATATGIANDVVLNDILPSGVTYVTGTAEKTYPDQTTTSGTFNRNLGSGTFDTGGLVQSYTVTSADVPAGATLTSYSITANGASIDFLADIILNATYPSGTAYALSGGDFGGNNSGSWSINESGATVSGAAEGTYTFSWDDIFNGVGGDDNSISAASFTIGWESSTSSIVTDAANAPANMVTAGDDVDLAPGETMTVTFDVIVDNPLDPAITQLLNTASATSSELPTPVIDTAIDDVLQQGSITGNVSEDTDFNGTGDTNLSGVTVELIQRFNVIDSGLDINGDGVINGSDDGFFAGFEIINGRIDINGDGVVDGSDDGTVGGVTVINSRFDINGDGSVSAANRPLDDGIIQVVIDTQTTDVNGNYSFDNVNVGEYIVVETNPPGLNDVSDQDDSNDGDAADTDTTVDNEIGVTLLAGETDSDNNFVDAAPVVNLSGNVFNDADGLTDSTVDGTGIGSPGGTQVYATLLDTGGNVVASVPIAADGSYSFANVSANTDYTIQLSTTDETANVGSAPSTGPALPTGWVNTGENVGAGAGAGDDGTVDGLLAVSVVTSDVTEVNFGIEQPPTANDVTEPSQINPGGTTQVQVPALDVTDPEDGTPTTIVIDTLPDATTEGVLYYNGVAVTSGQVIPGFDPSLLTLDPIDGDVTVDFTYSTIDAAGEQSPPATVTMPFTGLSLSGNVFNDADGLTDSTVDGTGIGSPSGTQVYATLLDSSGNVVASVPIAGDGTYTFPTVSANTDYTVQLSVTDETANVGSAPSTGPALPTGWVNTGENVGTGAGDDGTVDGLLAVSVVTSDVTEVNFGIEQPPVANDVTEPSQINPGGTTQVQVPALDVTDPEDGTPTTIVIDTLPDATTEGVLYYNGVAVTPGQVIPGFDPSLLTLDPIDGDVTVDFTYSTIDAAGEQSPPATVTMPFTGLSLSGNVFNDADGLTDSTVDGTGIGTPSGTQVYATLLDTGGNVVASVPIAGDGTYTFPNVSANTDYTVQLSTTDEAAQVGSAPSTGPALPAGWVNTGENVGAGAGDDGTVDGLLAVSVVTSDVTEVNFGIEQPPTANDVTEPSQINPGGTTQVQVPALDVTDPEDGTPTTIVIDTLPDATTEGVLYYNGIAVTPGQVIPGFDPSLLTLDPIDGDVTVDFTYSTIDAAGEQSPPATVTMPFTGLSLSGNVFNDADGLTNSTVDGTGIGSPGGTQVYATLLDSSGNVVASVPIAADGTYTFPTVSANTDYTVQLSVTDETANVGSAPSTGPALPTDWVNTGENVGAGAGDDGTVDGLLAVSVVTTSVTEVNFGIEQPPVANDVTEPSQINPGGTTQVQVPALDVTDPEDGTPTTIVIDTLPDATTEGVLYYNGVAVTPGQVIPGFDPSLLTLDPIDGDVTVDFTYSTIDAAGEQSPPATVTMPFTGLSLSGNVFNDADGLTDSTVDGTGIGTPSGTQVYASLLDSSGNVVASVPIAGDGTYTFPTVSANTDYTVQLSVTDETANVGSAPSTGPALPTDWVNTGENVGAGAGDDGTVDGLLAVSVVTSDVTEVNFGIEQPPVANDVTEPSQINPGGTTQVQVPALDVTDPEDGTPTTIVIDTLPDATTEGVLYYNGVAVTPGQVIPGFDPSLLTLDPIDGDVTVDFTYSTIDAAGEQSPPATVTMPFTGLSLSGNVFNDADGLTNSTVDGTGIGSPGGTQVYATLLDTGGNVVASVPIAADGTYTFPTVSANTDYTVQLSTTDETAQVGSAPSTGPALPTGWVNTGENVGAGAGDDGTVDGLLAVSVVTTSVTEVNFGIEQPPVANDVTEPSQINPGGTTQVQVPALDVTDPEDGTPTTIVIDTLPDATTEGVLYYNGVAVTPGQVIPGFDPSLLTLDPIDGDVTVDFTYSTIDAAGEQSPPATVTMPFTGLSLSGNVFNDADGLIDSTVDGTGIGSPGGTQVYATLLDTGGNVVASVPIAADGTYTFPTVSANTDYTVQLSVTDESGTVGSAPSTGPALPTDWVNTGENVGAGAGDDGTVDGLLAVSVVTTSVTEVNFGIEQPPVANDVTEPSQINPGGTTQVQVPALDVTDPEDGTPTTITITELPDATTEGVLYYNGVAVVAGTPIPNFDPTLLTLDPVDGDVTVDFLYTTTDAAGEESQPATVTMPFTGLSLSGNVFNDADGLTNSTVDGTGIGSPGGTQVYATLLDTGGNVVASVPIAGDGTYTFPTVSANTDYTVQLSVTDETTQVGSAPSTGPALPADWVNTGENVGAGAGDDGTVDGLLAVSVVTTSVTEVNFGIEQPPTANDVTEPSQINPGGTTQVQVPGLDVTDPEDGTPTTITITELPDATTEGVLYYNGVPVVAGTPIPNFDPTLLTLDPVDGDVTVDFLYTTTDAAGEESQPATVTMPFTGLSLSGNVFNDADGLTNSTVDGTGIGSPGGTQVYATLLDTGGNVVASVPIAGDGTYTFPTVSANTDYTVQLSVTDETTQVGSAPSTGPALPADWVNTGENVGAGAGDDGTVDGLLAVSVVTTSVTEVNFGIEQPPTANDVTEPSQINPGGTTQVQVPGLDVTDPEDGTPTTITITELPDATTEGVLYYNGVPVVAGTPIPNFDPTLLTLDPVDGDVTVDFLYTTTDAAGEESPPATVTMPFTGLSLSGNVFNDADGLTNSTVDGTGIGSPGGTQVYATLLDTGGNVVASVPIAADGTYTFPTVSANTDYTVQLSTTDETAQVGSAPSTGPALPADWVNTGENVGAGAGDDGTVDGLLAVSVVTTSVTEVNFGIEQPPTANDVTEPSQINPGGTTQVQVPGLDVTDPEDGTPTTITITELPDATTEGVLYYNGVPVVAGTPIPNFDPTLLTLDPIDGDVTVDFLYTTTDAAGEESPPATVTMPFTGLSLSGNVFNDADGLTNSTVDGTGIGSPGGTQVYATLLDTGGNVVASVPIAADGTYTFPTVSANTDYTVQLSTTDETAQVGSAPSTGPALPTDWVNTGENVGAGAGDDGTVDGLLAVSVVTTSVTEVNFGIEQPPVANDVTEPNQINPGGTTQVQVPALDVTDPEDGTPTTITITELPDATTEGVLYYNGVAVVAGTPIVNFDPTLLTLDPIDGSVTVDFLYTTTDAAGEESPPATVTMPFTGLSNVGDFVWIDSNGDGVQDAGEMGLTGVTVTLTPPSNVDLGNGLGVAITTTTDSNGAYLFSGVPAGSGYMIVFNSPTGYMFSPQLNPTDPVSQGTDSDADSNGVTALFDVSAGIDIDSIDAGVVPGGSIGDHIWLDTDGDGVDDIGEQGIAGVTVGLTGTATDGTAITLTTVTDANGDYLFDNLPPGNYTVTVTDTNGELTDLAQSPGNIGSEAVTLAAGEDFLDADFGYVPAAGTAVIGDTVWADEDGDGIQDPGEVGLAGVTLDLVDDNGTVVDTITTDASGNYLFTNVTPGDYTVVVTDTGGVITDPATNVTSGPQSPGSLTSTPITVLSDDIYVDADFGFTAQTGSTLSDRIWYDADGDGVQDAGEPGIGNVTVDLLDSNGVIIASVVTDSNGDFAFTGLPDGDYSIVITDDNNELTGYFSTTPPAAALRQEITGLSGDIVNQDPSAPNPVITGTGDGHPSFGFNQPGTIGDTLWNDANGDGVQDPGEGGLAGVTLTLTDSVGTVIDTATTDSNGNYLFTNVSPGTDYTVTVDSNNFSGGGALDGYTQTYDADDGTAANDNNSVLSLVDGESNLNQDFGYQNTALPTISGTVFYDVDTDGSNEPDGNDRTPGNSDDETGIAGVTIDLVDSTGTVVATTTTDVNGDYSFPDVPPADYTVEVTDTGSVLDGYTLTSGLDILPVSETQLNAGDVTDVDFGYVDDEQTASITSGLWIDSDKDGVRDPDETPIPNVDINLIDCGPDAICGNGDDTIVGTAVTDIDGNVIFEDLPPGVYSLDSIETDPDFPADITEIGNYSPNFNDPNDPIQLSEGETYDADFGYSPSPGTAGLSGTLWNDAEPDGSDGDGIQDASEVGLGGIPVQLLDVVTGNPVATAFTKPDGSYEFTGITPCPGTSACYSLSYDATSVTAQSLDGSEPTNTPDISGPAGPTIPDGLNDNIYLIHLEDGDFKEDHDFGFDAPAGTFGALDGNVYFEPSPADGVLTPGTDVGIESVTVNLVDSNGDLVATTTTSDGFIDVDGDGVIDPAGYYSFTNLVPGDYTVVVTDINNATIGLNPSGDPDEAGLCAVCDQKSDPVTVPAGPAPAPVNFGYMGEQSLGNIGNLIWYDVGGPSLSDGLFDPLQGDKGIAGVTVECWFDADGDKALTIGGVDNLIRTVTTDENGEYYCEGLPTGGYLVRVTDDAGRLAGSIAANLPVGGSLGTDGIAGTLDDLDSANKMAIPLASIPTSGPSAAWYIQTGSDNLTADFAITGTNSLSGTVFEEEAGTTANGLLDGSDAATPGVTVILLIEQPDGSFIEFTRTTTDVNGDYDFTGLPNGNYQVIVDTSGSSINGYGQTGDPDIPTSFCTSALSSICDDMAGSVTPIALTGGTDATDVDFGYQTDFVTTPITLGYFHAQSLGGGSVEINWQTVTEVAHLGFNLYVREQVAGETTRRWRRLNTDLIAPAAPGDSFDTREYSFTAYGVDGKRFALGDVDVTGNETIHGPFRLDRKAGADRAARAVTDWDAIQAKRAAKAQARQAKRKARAEKRLQKKLQRSKAKAAVEAKRLKSTKQTDAQRDRQEDREFEMLELDNEQCELEDCFGNELGQTDHRTGSSVHSMRSRIVGSLLAMLIPTAYALEPAVEAGVIEIETTQAGIYKVTYEDMFDLGIDIRDVPHEALSLTNNNEPVYIRSWGQRKRAGDRRYFGPGGGFEFVAEQSRTLYSKSNVYTLHVDGPNDFRKTIRLDKTALPAAGTVVDYYQETATWEPDAAYSTLSPIGDPWFGFQMLSSGADKTILIPYRVDNFASGKGSVETEVQGWGMTTGSHAVSIASNGQVIDSKTFSGINPVTLSGEIAVTALADGVNTYSLTIPGRGVVDQLALDKWQVTYPRWTKAKDGKTLEFEAAGNIISVSGLKSKWVRVIREDANGVMTWIRSKTMQRIVESDRTLTIKFPGTAEKARYYVSVINKKDRRVAQLTLPVVQDDLTTGTASYLIVSHPDFIDANMDRFVAAKQAQGFSVKVADVEAVYTTFGAGHFGAAAIRDYIAWAHSNLGTEMVLLVGDDMFDYHGNQYANAISFIPSIYASTSALVKMAPVDAKYVDFDDDDIPDMPIGRLNPKLAQEWAAMVDKNLNYGGHPNPQSIVFSADGFDAAQGYDFAADADAMLSRLPAQWQLGVSKYYIDELGNANARSGLLKALDDGPAVTAFVGHSGPRDWSFSGLFSASDASSMMNQGAPTVVTQWGCWNTYYATPNGSLANEFLRNPNGGAVAVLGAIALTEAAHEKALALEVYARLFVPGKTIGEAVLEAKQAYAADYPVTTHKDVILGWTLMADPSLVIQQ